jgi:hypothetical protein
VNLYRVIQTSGTVPKDVVGEIVWSGKCEWNFFRFGVTTSLRLCRSYCCECRILQDVNWSHCCNEISQILHFVTFFNQHFSLLVLEYLLFVWWGLVTGLNWRQIEPWRKVIVQVQCLQQSPECN